ncbi:MAG TPA: GNAT family N-acetyltransferase [bacterium]
MDRRGARGVMDGRNAGVTAETSAAVRLRPLQDGDFEALAELHTANFPEEPRTAAESRERYEKFDAERYVREYVVALDSGDRVVGLGVYAHAPWSFHPDKYMIYVMVRPTHQRRGIGARIMEHLSSGLRARGATRLRSWAREDYPHSLAFLARFGFTEYSRTFESRLPVARVDPVPFAGAEERARAAGITITTLAEELARDPTCLPALYQAHCGLEVTTPHTDPDLPVAPAYNHWLTHEVRHPRVPLEAFFLAKQGEFYVGESVMKRSESEADVLWQQLTAVHREFQGHGIATALKLRTIAYAQQHGFREIRTFNSSKNGAMLAINTKLGFIRQPAWIDFLLERSAEQG